MISLLCLTLAAILPAVTAATSSGCPQGYGFSYPNSTDPLDQNLTFGVGQKIDVQWRSPWPSVKLAFIGSDSNTFIFIDGISAGDTKSNYYWNVDVDNSNNDNNQYYFYIEDATDNTNNCYSALWNIDTDSVGTTTTSGGSTTQTTMASVTSGTTSVSTVKSVAITTGISGLTTILLTQGSPTAQAATSSPSMDGISSGLTTGAEAGIGVGVALAVIAIAGGLGAFIYLRRKRSLSSGRSAPDAGPAAVGAMAPGEKTAPGSMPASYYTPYKTAASTAPAAQELDSAAASTAQFQSLHEMNGQAEPRYEMDGRGLP